MKRFIVIFLLSCTLCTEVFAQSGAKSVYVSAKGNDFPNDGLSEAKPFKTLKKALMEIAKSEMEITKSELEINSKGNYKSITKITVIGKLDINSNNNSSDQGLWSLFSLNIRNKREIIITGKPDAVSTDRAVLSAEGAKKGVIEIQLGNFRFENIDIVGGEGSTKHGILQIQGNLTLGTSAVVRNNAGMEPALLTVVKYEIILILVS